MKHFGKRIFSAGLEFSKQISRHAYQASAWNLATTGALIFISSSRSSSLSSADQQLRTVRQRNSKPYASCVRLDHGTIAKTKGSRDEKRHKRRNGTSDVDPRRGRCQSASASPRQVHGPPLSFKKKIKISDADAIREDFII